MNIILKDKVKIDNTYIKDLITKSWQDSESIQSQIDNIDIDSTQAAEVVKLLKNLLTNYYIFSGCLENLEFSSTTEKNLMSEPVQQKEPVNISKISIVESVPAIDALNKIETKTVDEPFEYFIDFDEPTGEPLTDDDLYN